MSEESTAKPPVPARDLSDPRTLRALAHPVRMQIIDQLILHGPATATELAEQFGQSAANCSWHLRQLAKHGFIEEAGGGSGRQRPWRMVLQSTTITTEEDPEPEFSAARDALIETLFTQDLAALRSWQQARSGEPEQWREAAFQAQFNYIWLTAAELAAFKAALSEVIDQHIVPCIDRLDPARRPDDSRPTRFAGWAVPSGPAHQSAPAPAATSDVPTQ